MLSFVIDMRESVTPGRRSSAPDLPDPDGPTYKFGYMARMAPLLAVDILSRGAWLVCDEPERMPEPFM